MPQVTMELPEFVNLSKAADMLGISRPTLYKRMLEKGIVPTEIGDQPFLTLQQVDQLRQPKNGS